MGRQVGKKQHSRSHDTSGAGSGGKRRWLTRLFYTLALSAVILSIVLALAATGPVLRLATPAINETVSQAIDGNFELGDIRGSLWTGLRVEKLKVEIRQSGLHIDGHDLQLAWSPLALLHGTLHIDGLTATSLLLVMPSVRPDSEAEETSGIAGFSLPLTIKLEMLEIPEFQVLDRASNREFLYKIKASGSVGRNRSIQLAVDFLPVETAVDRLHVDLLFDADRQDLHAAIEGHLDRAGIFMTLAGLQPEEVTDMDFSLQGKGSATDWQGQMDFSAADRIKLSGNLALQLRGEYLEFNLAGNTRTLPSLADQLPKPLRGKVDIDLAGRLELPTKRLILNEFKLRKKELITAAGSAEFDPATNRLVADLKAGIETMASDLTGGAVHWQSLQVQAHAEGQLGLPDITCTVQGHSVATPFSLVDHVSLTFDLAAETDHSATQLKGAAQGIRWKDPDLGPVFGDRLDIDITGGLSKDFSQISIEDLTAVTAGMQLTGRGELSGGGGLSDFWLQVDSTDLSRFRSLAGLELKGIGRVTLKQGVWQSAEGGRADIEITGSGLDLGQVDLNHLIGPQPKIAGNLQISPQLDLGLKFSTLKMAAAEGGGEISLGSDFSRIQGAIDFTVHQGAVPPQTGVKLAQAANLTVSLDGPISAPAAAIRLAIPQLTAGGEHFRNLKLTSTLLWSDDAVPSLKNRVDVVLRGKAYRLQALAVLPSDRLLLEDLLLQSQDIDLAGRLVIPGYQPPVRGAITVSRIDLGLLGDLGLPIAAGHVDGNFHFEPDGQRQRIVVKLAARNLQLTENDQTGSIDKLQVVGQVDDSFSRPIFKLQLDASGINGGQATVETLQAILQGDVSRMQARMTAEGQAGSAVPLTLDASADLALGEEVRLTVDSMNVGIGRQQLALRQPLQLTRAASGEIDSAMLLGVGDDGSVDLTLHLLPDARFEASIDLQDLALAPWAEMFGKSGISGTVSGSAAMSEEKAKSPQARFNAAIRDIRLDQAGSQAPLNLQLAGALGEDRGKADLLVQQRPDLQMVKINVAGPLKMSILKGQTSVDPEASLTAHAEIDGEIYRFWSYLPSPDNLLRGQIKLVADLSGSLAAPAWDGVLQLRDGRYEHLGYGTLLNNLQIDGRFDQGGLWISEISADDGGNGSLTGKAELHLADQSLVSYSSQLTLHDMAVTRMDEMRIWADADVDIAGDSRSARVSSKITVNHGEVDLEEAMPPSIPQLDVVNLKEPDEKAAEQQADSGNFTANLDVTVDIPGHLFVRGKGLDSEWEGNLAVSQTADSPRIIGQLQARRGRFDILGKTFLVRDSKITFFGGQPPDPGLAIVGVYSDENLTVTASLAGPASSAKLTFSSQPYLPQEEILSRVLFGTTQSNLSPLQALQLAQVVSKISGVGSGLDLVGSLRHLLNVDVLRVEGGESGPQVEVGKYLTEGVYVGTKRGVTSGSTGVEVEIELTPHLKMTSESTEIDNKTGIQFQWDY